MSEMVGRVENAILQKIEEMFGAIHCNSNGAVGRAAIEAMREPTEAMRVAALNTTLPEADDPPLYEKCWRAMINAALT